MTRQDRSIIAHSRDLPSTGAMMLVITAAQTMCGAGASPHALWRRRAPGSRRATDCRDHRALWRTDPLVGALTSHEAVIVLRVQRGNSIHPPGDALAISTTNRAMSVIVQILDEHGVGSDPGASLARGKTVSMISPSARDSLTSDSSEATWEKMLIVAAKESSTPQCLGGDGHQRSARSGSPRDRRRPHRSRGHADRSRSQPSPRNQWEVLLRIHAPHSSQVAQPITTA